MFESMNWELLTGEALEILKTLPDESVNMCVTSPPYYGLRDYDTGHWEGGDPNCPHYRTNKVKTSNTGHQKMSDTGHPVGDAIYKSVCPLCGAVRVDKQIGLEETPEEYIQRLVEVFREFRRVLKDDGTLWVNIGDSYNSSVTGKHDERSDKQHSNTGSLSQTNTKSLVKSCKPKDLLGIPWMLAFALRNDGWYLRQDIIWEKPNPMPESVKDRCTKSHEYIFLLSKSSDYYFDNKSIQEVATSQNGVPSQVIDGKGVRNKRDVWTVAVNSYREAHFATFPEKLIEPCILASCPSDGVVLDMFNGSGTTGVVALRNGRKYIGIELNPNYVELSRGRLLEVCGATVVSDENGANTVLQKCELF